MVTPIMTAKTLADLYRENYVDKDYERLDLFALLAENYGVSSALYPGCYIHVTPSFVYPVTAYVDTDRRAKQFFSDPATLDFINQHKQYDEAASLRFHPLDYTATLPEADETFDLLISQYTGFIAEPCKRYLKIGGLLLVNNSHGDAGMASLDADYELIGVILGSNRHYRLSDKDLSDYFVPKSNKTVTREYIVGHGRGVAYKKAASNYLFRRVR